MGQNTKLTSEFKTEWNLESLFGDEGKIQSERESIKKKVNAFVQKWKGNTEYLNNPRVLLEALKEYEGLGFISGNGQGEDGGATNEYFYYWLKLQIDESNPALKAKLNMAQDFVNELTNDMRFFLMNISKVPSEVQKKFLASSELMGYKHILERMFNEAKHLLNEEEEKILQLKARPANDDWVKMLSGFLSKEERDVVSEEGKLEKKNFSEIQNLISSKNKKVRDSAALAFNEILLKNRDVAEAEINALLADKKIDDELRKFTRPDASRHLSDDVDSGVVDVLINSVSERNDIATRYYKLKARLMGLAKLEYHERNVEYGSFEKKYEFEEAAELVKMVLDRLDGEFSSIYVQLFEKGQVDVFPKKGKRSGAFCTDNLIYQPTYVLLNHTESLNDVLAIAHEFGHAINSELMKKKQHPLTFGTVLSTAEVASTFMEDFVFEELMKGADEEGRLVLIMAKLNDDISSIFRQVACYKFEQEMHSEFRKKGYLSHEEIGKIFQRNMASYMGEGVEMSSGSENWWVYWRHIRSYFYVYSYANGLLISKALQKSVRENHGFVEKVKGFLSSGFSESPKDIFRKLGVDITKKEFWGKGLDEIEELLSEADVLAKKLGKI